MEISYSSAYPGFQLSNLADHPFVLDGVRCRSMEGFLQSLKYGSTEHQESVCALPGMKARLSHGGHQAWTRNGVLWWRGDPIQRRSPEYSDLLGRAFRALLDQNPSYRRALLSTGGAVLTHTIGSTNRDETVLTRDEFCSILTEMRAGLRSSVAPTRRTR
jgi:hypothetical protein